MELVRNMTGKIGLAVLGLLQGTIGSYLAVLGFAFAFPGTSPDSKDYEEDMFFVPLGYGIMFLWLAVMAAAVILLRRNKAGMLAFFAAWFIGLAGFISFTFIAH